jgi:hypothetical protein
MSQYLGSSIEGKRIHDLFTTQSYNVNQNHPLIPNQQEYIYVDKFVSIHSEDRDLTKYPNASEFEIEMPEDLLNVAAIRLIQWTFPANYSTFSTLNNNVNFSFKITNPYNPGENNLADDLAENIFQALWLTQNTPYNFLIEEGFYNPIQMATELTNKFNYTVTSRIIDYFTAQGWTNSLEQFAANGGYQNFIIAYNNVSLKLWFGNRSDGFILLNENSVAVDILSADLCSIGRTHVPDASLYGLPGFLGLPRCNTESISSTATTNTGLYNNIQVPRFYYGDVFPGDNGYWLLPLDLSGCQVHWVEAPYKINLMGEAFIYMELAGQNCIDETQPYSVSNFTLTTNQTNGIVNSAFAKLPVPTTPLSQWFDRESIPYKWYLPPAERMRRLKVRLRYHNGRLVDFGLFNFSFMLQFIMMSPQILRSSKSSYYPPGK